MTSWQTRAVRLYLRATRKKRYRTVEAGRRSLVHALPAAPVPEELAGRVRSDPVGGGEVVTVRPADGADLAPDGGVLVHLHGGAFVNGIMPQHWSFVGGLADRTGRVVHVARYPLAPAHSVDDAHAFLAALVDHLGGTPVHVLGDSAGGNLALLLAQRHPDAHVVGLTLVAPWVDLAMDNPAMDAVERRDPWLTRVGMRPIAAHWLAGRDAKDPDASPLHGDLSGLPPTLVLVGDRDICRPDCDRLATLARDAGSDVELHVEAGSPHVYPLLPTPEGARAREQVVRHVRRSFEAPVSG
ncbi:alpha/beta fold hydrolase [Phycicoccus avicenniae]|uniref:alpha/beta fold hydrolase n=1 Tax=Phycicoccus avicenniae TaxID=2828860 RepID=UPI003D2DE221